jgi:hypothetical protein
LVVARLLWDCNGESAAAAVKPTQPPHPSIHPPAHPSRAVNRQADDRTEEELAKYIEERYK